MIEIDDLRSAIAGRKAGDRVKVEYRRGGEYLETEAALTLLSSISGTLPAER